MTINRSEVAKSTSSADREARDPSTTPAGDRTRPPVREDATSGAQPEASEYSFREPTVGDGAGMHALIGQTGTLEANSPYSYIMLADHFPDTCVIAERRGETVGVVSAFISPDRGDTVFVWQIGVAPEEQGRGLGKRMLHEILARPACREVRYLEATVTPSNRASGALFRSMARDMGVPFRMEEGFGEEHFPGDGHEPERLFRIGPFTADDIEKIAAREDEDAIFEEYESNVRSYCRDFPTIFEKARGCRVWDEDGREFLDFFAGAGALNYGHNEPTLKEALLEYVASDGITHALDMATVAKRRFLERFHDVILEPRGMSHRMMFPGPTGTNAVESALKLARKVTARETVVCFTNSFHGMTLGALAVTGNSFKRSGAGVPLMYTATMPYDGYLEGGADSLEYMEQMIEDGGSGVDKPAAVIVETVQGEGGVHVASHEWLRGLEQLCRRHEMLLIVDDVQMGCGRTGPFFSFEPAGISPDIVCLSKSIGGYGLPMALTLVKPEYDQFAPGEHNGTFRGNNPAFVTATAALSYWENDELSRHVQAMGGKLRAALEDIAARHPGLQAAVRGRGLIHGLEIGLPGLAGEICSAAFERGLILETSGPESEVIKVMPPLIIDEAALQRGLRLLAEAVEAVGARQQRGAERATADEETA